MGSRAPWPSRACTDVAATAGAAPVGIFMERDRFQLPNGALLVGSPATPLAPDMPDHDFVHVQFHGPVSLEFCGSPTLVVWSVPRQVLVQKLAMLSGRPVASDLQFECAVLPDAPGSSLVLRLLDTLLAAVRTAQAGSVVVAELEQVLITAFLEASRHDWQQRLAEKPRGAAPWQVHRAETYIEQNWHKPITIEDLAEETGASPRSIFRAFQQSRGYTPLEYAKAVRLGHARRLLESADCTSVTEAAFACGFGDLGRFSKDFAQAFGERPSAVLSRRKATA